MTTPVTIGLPVYNGAKFLAETLDNWLGQDYGDFRMIVSNNASSDGTPAILADYAKRDSRIRVIRRDATVPAAQNFNELVAEADTPYFAWSSCDDLREPSFLPSTREGRFREYTTLIKDANLKTSCKIRTLNFFDDISNGYTRPRPIRLLWSMGEHFANLAITHYQVPAFFAEFTYLSYPFKKYLLVNGISL